MNRGLIVLEILATVVFMAAFLEVCARINDWLDRRD